MNSLVPSIAGSITPELARKTLIITSHSIDNLFDYCARKFEFAHLFENRPLEGESGYAADVGTALHRGIQGWLAARHEGRSETEARIIGGWAFLRSFPWEEEADQYAKTRSFEAAAWTLDLMWDHPFWNEWELVKVTKNGIPKWAIEVPWIIIHTSLGPTNDGRFFATQGTIDLIMRNKLSGIICPVDIKTTIYDKNLTRALYTYSGQQIGYGQIVEAMLGNHITELTYQYFIARISPEQPSVEVKEFNKTQEELEDYWIDKLNRLERMKGYVNRKHFPRTNGGCFSYSRECSFFDICKSRDEEMLAAWFRDSINAAPRELPDWWVRLEI